MRVLLFALAACLVTAVLVAPSSAAASEPIGFCNDDALVDYCQPVCIDGPCYGYVCVNGPIGRCLNG